MKEKLRKMLIESAKKGETLYYSQLDKRFGFSSNPFGGMTDLFKMLADIGKDEIQKGRPPINCIVIRKIELDPGDGFFKWYKKAIDRSFDIHVNHHRRDLFERLKKEVFDYWANEMELTY